MHRGRDLLGQRPGVADARRAAVPHEVVAQLLQVRPEPGLVVVVGDDLRARGHRGLHPRLDGQALVDGVLRQQRRAEHHRRVRRVRARRDRGDHHRAVVELEGGAVVRVTVVGLLVRPCAPAAAETATRGCRRRRCRARRGWPGRWPGRTLRRTRRRRSGGGCGVRVVLVRRARIVGQRAAERLLGLAQRDPVLRALRPRDRGHDGRQVQLEGLGVHRLPGRVVPQPLLLGVRLDERDLLVGPPGELEVPQRLVVDGEDRRRRAELGAHVPDRRPVRQRHRADALAVELDELAHHAVPAQHLGDRQHHVGGGGAGRDLPGELEPDDARDEHRHRLAEHRRLGLDAADAPAEHAEPVDHRRVRVGADERVRVAPGPSRVITTRARYSMLTWWTIPVPGGTTLNSLNAPWPQRRNW